MPTWIVDLRDKVGRRVAPDAEAPPTEPRRFRKVTVDSGSFSEVFARAQFEVQALNTLDQLERTGRANMSEEEVGWLSQDGRLELGVAAGTLALGRESGGYTVAHLPGAGVSDRSKGRTGVDGAPPVHTSTVGRTPWREVRVHVRRFDADKAPSASDDAEVAGIYTVEVGCGLSDEEAASAALDAFHSSIAVRVLEDFEFEVFDGERELVEAPDAQSYASTDYGDVWKVGPEPGNAPRLTPTP